MSENIIWPIRALNSRPLVNRKIRSKLHLDTTSGRISIFSILISSSPGNWKYFTSCPESERMKHVGLRSRLWLRIIMELKDSWSRHWVFFFFGSNWGSVLTGLRSRSSGFEDQGWTRDQQKTQVLVRESEVTSSAVAPPPLFHIQLASTNHHCQSPALIRSFFVGF